MKVKGEQLFMLFDTVHADIFIPEFLRTLFEIFESDYRAIALYKDDTKSTHLQEAEKVRSRTEMH